MKKALKISAATVGVLIVLSMAGGTYLYMKFRAETGKMTTLETGQATEGVYAIRDGYTNFYLVEGKQGYIAIDAGDQAENIKKELRKLKIDESQIMGVFLTHTDRDHIAALSLFGKARVFISKDEEQMINGKTPRFFSFLKNSLPGKYETMADNQTLEISGIQIRGIATPGHTPGTMCYLVNGRYLFTGDSMSLKEGRAGLFNEFFNMDSETQKKALHKLKGIPDVKYVFTAHYGGSDNHAFAFENW